MPSLVMDRSYAGYWGWGDDDAEALRNYRASGGRKKDLLLILVNDFYTNPRVHPMGDSIEADPVDPENDGSHPPVIDEVWAIGPRGSRKERLQ